MHKDNIRHIITSESRVYIICNLLSPVISHSRCRMIPLLDQLYTCSTNICTSIISVWCSNYSSVFSVFMFVCSAWLRCPFVSLQNLIHLHVFPNLILCHLLIQICLHWRNNCARLLACRKLFCSHYFMLKADDCTVYYVTVSPCSHFIFLFSEWFKCPKLNHIWRILSSLFLNLWLLILCHIFAKYFVVQDKSVITT